MVHYKQLLSLPCVSGKCFKFVYAMFVQDDILETSKVLRVYLQPVINLTEKFQDFNNRLHDLFFISFYQNLKLFAVL